MTSDDLTVYDTVTAAQVEASDSIAFIPVDGVVQEIMMVSRVVDEGDSILITGESYVSGDSATYILKPEHEVDLWTL